jgi:uncharacterized membrane protein
VAKEFINPNWHVLLIHYPLGVFVLGMVIELFSLLYRGTTLRAAGRWMILIGALSAVPTALSGVYAFANVARMDLPQGVSTPDQPWHEVWSQTQLNTEQREHLRQHTFSQAIATGVCALLATLALGCSDEWRRKLYFPILLGLLFGLVAMLYGSWHGGEMVYRHGTAVLRVEHQGAMPEATKPQTSESAADDQTEKKHGPEYFVPPLQLHVFLAGLTVSFALGALGLSMRAIATHGVEDYRSKDLDEFGLDRSLGRDALDPPPPLKRGTADLDVARSLNPDAGVDAGRERRLPVSRTWLLAFFLGAGAALAGWWFLGGADETRTWQPRRLWEMVVSNPRRLYHTVTSGVIVLVPLLLALITRVSRRPKALLTVLSLVLFGAVALQVWLGVLLMFDTERGPVTRFNRPGEAPATLPTSRPATQAVVAGQ